MIWRRSSAGSGTSDLGARVASLIVVAGCLSVATTASAAPSGEIPLDPAVTVGKLDNGLTYIVRANGKPKARADLRLVVQAGSVDEADDQRGLAHFLEHMLFNGTESFPSNEIIDYLESIGARFGADLNAYTSFDETVYMLEIPTDRDELLDRGLAILGEFAHRATIEPDEVERERGVVLDEWRRGLGAGSRIRDQQLPILLKGSRYAERLPIGDPAILEKGDPEAIRRFYQDWYRPERMAVVAVGDFDVDSVVAGIRREFGMIPRTDDLGERVDWDVPAQPDTLFALADDDELRGTSVGFSTKRAARGEATTWPAYRRDLVERLAIAMFNDRMFELSRSDDPPFLGAGLGVSGFGRVTELVSESARVEAGGEARGLEALLTETLRARRHGFLPSELERMKAEYLAGIEATAAEREKTSSASYVSEYTRHFLTNEPIPGIDAELSFTRDALPGIDVAECSAAFRDLTGGGGLVVEASRPTSRAEVGEVELRASLRAAAASDPAPWVERTVGTTLVEHRAAPGTVVSRREIADLGLTEAVLSNGLTVYLKPTEFQDDTIVFQGLALGGTSQVEDEDVLSAGAASGLVSEAGYGGHSRVDLDRILTGKVASASPYFQERWHGVSGSSTIKDLDTALDLALLVMTEPNDDPAAFARWRTRVAASLANRASDPSAKYFDRLTEINTNDHPRERPFTADRLDEIDPAVALAFYRKCFENPADFAFFFVGNLDPDDLLPRIARTLGSLPASSAPASRWVDRGVMPADHDVRETVYAGREPRSLTTLTFPSYGGDDPDEWHRLRTACSILERRLRETLREDLGATYGVSASYRWNLVGPARGTIVIRYGCAPDVAQSLGDAALEVLRSLRETGPSEEELATEKEIQSRELETSLEQNGFWLGNLYGLWLRGRDLHEVLDRQDRIDALDLPGLTRTLRENVDPDHRTWVDWLPVTANTESPAADVGAAGLDSRGTDVIH
ncbi:MAG: insulinase family protein [Gemmatimonadetes bacterium]|nr:insulinase family protein [Gemmatimonadota bacterium]